MTQVYTSSERQCSPAQQELSIQQAGADGLQGMPLPASVCPLQQAVSACFVGSFVQVAAAARFRVPSFHSAGLLVMMWPPDVSLLQQSAFCHVKQQSSGSRNSRSAMHVSVIRP